MTIRLAMTAPIETGREEQGSVVYDDRGFTIAVCDTEAEAQAAKRAFEQVLLPRFTRDEAIAIVKAALAVDETPGVSCTHDLHAGIRLALKALAAAGVFVDSDPCPWCEANREVTSDPGASCETCDGSGRLHHMADKLDAAGIR